MDTWRFSEFKDDKYGLCESCVWSWEPGNPGITAGPLWRGGQKENHVCLQNLGPQVGASPVRAQTLTLAGPGHQLSSVDLERIIGKDRDQDDAKYLWGKKGIQVA